MNQHIPHRHVIAGGLLFACACAPSLPATAPEAPKTSFARLHARAFEAEAIDPVSADGYFDLLDGAIAAPASPDALAAAIAAVDALVTADSSGFDDLGAHAMAFRSRDLAPVVVDRLRRAWAAASASAPVRGRIASALYQLALFTGDRRAASVWGQRRGCARSAALIGPLAFPPLQALDAPSPIQHAAPLASSYAGIAPFSSRVVPIAIETDRCQLDTNVATHLQGLRALVVDVTVPKAETIHLALTSTSAAVVDAGGLTVIRRGFEAGGRAVTKLGRVDVADAGVLRVVVRVANKADGGMIELDVLDERGEPLVTRAPAAGDAATVTAVNPRPIEIAPSSPDARALAASALMSLGEHRAAEHLLETRDLGKKISASEELLYARAVEGADDLPDTKQIERVRSAIDRALTALPSSWEARVGHARATERRKGAGEGVTDALRELGAAPRAEGAPPLPADALSPAKNRMIAAYAATLAHRAQILDVMAGAYDELARQAPGSSLLALVDARIHGRTGMDWVKAACLGGGDRSDTRCLEAHSARRDYGAAFAELERLRVLRGGPTNLRDWEMSLRVMSGDLDGALKVYDAMAPAERRMLDVLGFAVGRGALQDARTRLDRDLVTARDAPFSILSLRKAIAVAGGAGGVDPIPELEAEGARLVEVDKKSAFLPGAGTAVLRHVERYTIEPSGLVHFLTYDLRRVSGTTDVAMGAYSYGPAIEGRTSSRVLRKRIHKPDGRVLSPDAAANAQQASDLSQLEKGDYVEMIAEGVALPGDGGQIVIDTPDLMPERTSVRSAEIVIARPADLALSRWSHPLLGRPEETVQGAIKTSIWRLTDKAPRRIEDGVPKMERAVAVSLGTQTWATITRAMQENVRSLEDSDPYVVRWANEAAGDDKKIGRALVDRVVGAAGKRIKVGGGGELSDVAALYSGGSQRMTARTTLELRQGSRTWVIYRALRALGVSAEIAVAETEPFSAAHEFPPHAGRFRHPLVVAHLDKGEGGDVWIDADVEGPPLPPGRISPELRGRSALLSGGSIVTVEGSGVEQGDEVDVRLVLDAKGDAKGTFTVLLHGLVAQGLAEAFETVVGTERRDLLRQVVLGWVPRADVEEVQLSSSEGSWEVALRATIAIHGYGRPEGKDGKTWVLAGLEPVHGGFPKPIAGTLGGIYASRGARQNALSIEAPLQYHLRRRVELPSGATVARAPDKVEVVDARVKAKRTITVNGGLIEEDFALSLPTGTIAAGAYQAFVEHVQAVDNGFLAGTRVKIK